MLRAIQHDDVTQLECSTRASRSLKYAVSAFVTRGVMVDTGFPAVATEVERWVEEARPAGAFVTHYHEDHAGNVSGLARRAIPIAMAAATFDRVRRPKPIGWYRRICWGAAAPVDATVEPFAHPALTLVSAPGHSLDHHVVWDAERETMFGGDLFIGVKVRLAHPGEDIRQQVGTLRAMAALRPRRFFDAHRGRLERPEEQLLAKAAWTEEMIGEIEARARQGWEIRAIRNAVLGREDLTGWLSVGDYAKINFVQSVIGTMAAPSSRNGIRHSPTA